MDNRSLHLAFLAFAVTVSSFSTSAFVPTALVHKTRIHRFADTTGSFEYETNVPKGKLVVSFELFNDDDPKPKPPTPSTPPNEVFPGVALPKGKMPEAIQNEYTREKVGQYLGAATFKFAELIGKPKRPLTVAQEVVVGVNELANGVPYPKEYKFFGNGQHAKSLALLLKTNPFWAFALTEKRDGFELKCFDPYGKNDTLFLKIMSTLNGAGHRVNFEFDSNMNFRKVRLYDDVTGERRRVSDDKLDEYASSAMYNVFFFSSCVHATIHVLHYLMTSALQYSSQDFPAMNLWAKDYARNVQTKYEQVGQLLIADAPVTPAVIQLKLALEQVDQVQAAKMAADTLAQTFALITGPGGFGSSQAVRHILKDMLDNWGKASTAKGWLDYMMNVSDAKMEKAGILCEFQKHCELIKPFAKSATAALRDIDQDQFTIAELSTKDYLKSCGTFQSSIDTIESWIEIMSITGVVHGSTLSYTRLLGIKDVLKWRNIVNPAWDTFDINLLTGGLGTIAGMEDGRHVMSSTMSQYAPKLQAVLDEYDGEALKLKKEYKEEIMKDKERFENFGWILSDFCPDEFDGKQLTVAAYI